MMRDVYPLPDMFDVSDDAHAARGRHPSETRDFTPSRGGWAGIILATLLLAWAMWQLRGDDVDSGWVIASVVTGYFVTVIAWTAIRRERDWREDTRHET